MAMTRTLGSLGELRDDYDLLLCDVWGVVHNGVAAFQPAVAALGRARAAGQSVILVTNAPRPAASVARQLDSLGVSRDAYDGIVTSGDVTRGLVERYAGQPVYHLGPARDASLFEGLSAQLTGPDAAVAIVCTGLFDDVTETPASYDLQLSEFAHRHLPFICANPDLLVERGNTLCYCAGALAALYAAKGGPVIYAGKPHAPIYEQALAMVATIRGGPVGRSRVLAIGDGLGTDMQGAGAFGIDALFIPSGVSVPAGAALDIDALFAGMTMRPVALQPQLAWP